MNAKKKGNRGENVFSEWLRSKGVKAFRDSASGGSTHKGDIVNNIDFAFEVKTVKKLNVKEAWRQVDKDSSQSHSVPCLAIHFDGMGENEWLMVMHSEDWAEYILNYNPEKTTTTQPQNNSDTKWAIENAKRSLKTLLSKLEQYE